MKKNNKIFIAGHNGMVGSAFYRELKNKGFKNLVTKNRMQLDLKNKESCEIFFKKNKLDIVILAAAVVGGVHANNDEPVKFILDNLRIQNNIIELSYKYKVKKLLFVGSSCIYPNTLKQKIKESDMLSSYLEKTNEPYAVAKISGLKLCESFNREFKTDFRSVIPCNLYGPNDNYDLRGGHVFAALIKKFYLIKKKKQKNIILWGSGKPKREFMHVDDMAKASIEILKLSKKKYNKFTEPQMSHINVGTGKDVSILDLAKKIAKAYKLKDLKVIYDQTKPDGTKRKLMDVSKLINSTRFKPKYSLEKGISHTIKSFLNENAN
ncbi:GDP-L-fucose synthase [Candidatus Pelagibacter ubique]|nr:GDP-L-fucose synthase [Candidatus Pelagibacter ubique]